MKKKLMFIKAKDNTGEEFFAPVIIRSNRTVTRKEVQAKIKERPELADRLISDTNLFFDDIKFTVGEAVGTIAVGILGSLIAFFMMLLA